jgi:hypothetical protein
MASVLKPSYLANVPLCHNLGIIKSGRPLRIVVHEVNPLSNVSTSFRIPGNALSARFCLEKNAILAVILSSLVAGCGQPKAASSPKASTDQEPSSVAATRDSVSKPAPSSEAGGSDPIPASIPQTAQEHSALREKLDATIWSGEVDAQRHEEPFIRLWDSLRLSAQPIDVLRDVQFNSLQFGTAQAAAEYEMGIRTYELNTTPKKLDRTAWLELLTSIQDEGYSIVQTEWHHGRFQPAKGGEPARSTVSFVIDLKRDDPARRVTLRGNLEVRWKAMAARGDTSQATSDRLKNPEADALPQFDTI